MNIDTLILSHTSMSLCEMDSRLERYKPEIYPNISLNLALIGSCDMFYSEISHKMIMNPNVIGGYNEIEITKFLNKINNVN